MNSLSKEQIVVGGILLGDGHLRIQKAGKTPQLEIGHSIKQYRYLKWKCALLKFYGYEMTIRNVIHKHNGKKFPSVIASSRTSENLVSIHNLFYKDGRKVIPKDFAEQMDELSLAILFMDDGSAKIRKRMRIRNKHWVSDVGYVDAFMIATNCFTFEEVRYLSYCLKEKFDIQSHVQKDRGKPRLSISAVNDKMKFLTLVRPYVEQNPSLLYKIDKPLRFSDSKFDLVEGNRAQA